MRGKWMWNGILYGVLLLAGIMACRAEIEVYRADTVQPVKAETVKPVQADTVKPVQAETPEVVAANPIALYFAPTLDPYTGTLADNWPGGPRWQQVGMLRFPIPCEWTQLEQGPILAYVAPNLPAGQACLFMIFPAETVHGDMEPWFLRAMQGALGEGVQLVGNGDIVRQIAENGDESMSATRVTENAKGERMYAYFFGIKHGPQRQVCSFVSTNLDLFFKHLPTLQMLTRNTAFVVPPAANETPPPADKGVTPPAVAPKLANPAGNAVEPLSNGLLLNMTTTDVLRKFGEPGSDDRAWGGGIGYGGFGMMFNAKGTEIWHFTLSGANVRLNSGLTIGSTRADVKRVFGSEYPGTYDQYAIEISYGDDGKVTKIKIDPANGAFKPFRKIPLGGVKPEAVKSLTRADLVGTWHSTAITVATIVVNADGTYLYNGTGKGTYTFTADEVIFAGPLAAWNNFHATLKNGNLEFNWKNPDGAINWFSFAKE